jgi:outer membrane protein assembly factor BamE (lipoprotein component of BamABCDE complex)
MKNILLAITFFIVFGCASTPESLFQTVAIGDDKGSVLAKLGNPTRTYYKEDTHRWVYQLKDNSGALQEKEVWFQNGSVVYFDTLKTKKASDSKKPIRFEPVN